MIMAQQQINGSASQSQNNFFSVNQPNMHLEQLTSGQQSRAISSSGGGKSKKMQVH